MAIEIIAGITLAEGVKLVWDKIGKDVAAKATQGLWKKVEFRQALARYKEEMEQRYNNMNILNQTRPMPLAGLFTQVNVLSKPAAFRRHPKEIEHLEKVFLGCETFGGAIEKGKDGLQAVRENRRLFILGKPGAGKTTFLKYVTLQALADELAARTPILILLRDLPRANVALLDFIVRQFEICDFPDARPFVTALLKQGGALVLFDGLDEVNVDQAERANVVRAIETFSQEYDQSQIVITCRVAAEEYHFADFTYVEMADFEPAQVRVFVEHWFASTPNIDTHLLGKPEEHAAKFFAEFENNKRLHDLAKSPLLLTLLCIGFEEAQTFPDRRSEIYQEALDVLLRKWDKSRGIARDVRYQKLSLARKHQMFARLAAETFERGEYLLPLDRLAHQVAAYMRHIPQTDPNEEIQGEEVVKEIEAQHGIFVERAQGIYSFAHLTFQEYYTTLYLKEHPAALPNLVTNHVNDSRWQEVFLLTAEMLADADDFFDLWLRTLDDMARQSERLMRLLKLVEQQAPTLQLDDDADKEVRAVFASYTPLQRRAVSMRLRTETAFNIIADTTANARADNAAVSVAVAAVAARAVVVASADDVAVAIATATAAAARADDTDLSDVGAFIIAIGALDPINDAAEWLALAIRRSQGQGLNALTADLQAVKLPADKKDKQSWRAASQQLVTIFRAHFPAAEYELTEDEAWQVGRYLQSTALLLRCLQNAYVSNRATIEDRLLRAPAERQG